MFASHDQENLLHAHQRAAAAKPLNQLSKTPAHKAPKTPFKIPLNDENAPFRAGKSVLKTQGKGNENVVNPAKGKGKGVEVDKSAFVTPAGPRTRAPLGAKTTNAKTHAFQTPAPPSISASPTKTSQKTLSPRLRRAKVKVHQASPTAAETEHDEREVEHMPPRGTPLPDYPTGFDEWGPDKTFPQFEGKNLTRGFVGVYLADQDEDRSKKERRERQREEELDELLMRSVEGTFADLDVAAGVEPAAFAPISKDAAHSASKTPAKALAPTSRKLTSSKGPPTLTAKTAASVLSRAAKPALVPVPTKARQPTSLLTRKTRAPATAIAPTSARHASAAAASRTTLGYAQGRAASSSLRKPLGELYENPTSNAQKPSAARGSVVRPEKEVLTKQTVTDAEAEVEEMLRMRAQQREEDDDDRLLGGRVGGVEMEDEFDGFQLSVPEELM